MDYRVEVFWGNCCSVSGFEQHPSDNAAINSALRQVGDNCFAVLVQKYNEDADKDGWRTLTPIFSFDKRGAVTVHAPLKREDLEEAYDKLTARLPIYVKLKNGEWKDTIFKDVTRHFLKSMIAYDEIEYITNTIGLLE